MVNKDRSASTGKQIGAVAVLALIGAALSRWHGGGFIGGSPKILKAFLWALPFAGCAAFAHHSASSIWWATALWCAGVLAWSMVFKNTGHGQYMSVGKVWKKIKPEKLDFIVRLFFGDDPRAKK